eukprot:PITA_13872
MGYNSCTIKQLNCWGGIGHTGADIHFADLGMNFRIYNIYGPCQNRPEFWEYLLGSELFLADHLILGGDLNFSIGHAESWGHRAQRDPLSDYFSAFLDSHQLIDIPTTKLQATWRNNRIGEQGLACRLDHFLVKEKVLELGLHIRQWLGTGGLSDHLPIYMEIIGGRKKPKGPSKFSSTWLWDDSYILMVTKFCKENPPGTEDEHKERITSLYSARGKILKDHEEALRLRSRAIWMKEGDANTKLYHKFSNGRKAINTIWQLQNAQGQVVKTFQKLDELTTSHFKQIYCVPREVNLEKIIGVAQLFPRLVEQEEEEDLSKAVSLEELEATLKWFKKYKIPGPDGWSIDFFTAFFDIIGED